MHFFCSSLPELIVSVTNPSLCTTSKSELFIGCGPGDGYLWQLPLIGEFSTFIQQLWRLGILRKSMVPGSWLMWSFPEMGLPLFIIHFRLGFSTFFAIHFGAPQFMETLRFSWLHGQLPIFLTQQRLQRLVGWPQDSSARDRTQKTTHFGMAYSTYKNGDDWWCKWHCFTHIRWLWAITWYNHAIILPFLKLRMVNHG